MKNRERQRANRRKKYERLKEPKYCSRTNCHCNVDSYCIALNDTVFLGKPCPFFKTHAQAQADSGAALLHLVEKGRCDLIAKYYGGQKNVD